MEKLKMSFEVKTSNFELMKRLDEFCNELEISTDEAIEIAVERFLNDFNEIVSLWTCRKALVQRPYIKLEAGDIF